MATGDKLVNLDELKLVYDKLHVPSVQVQIPTGQWSGSSTRTYTVNATNVTADTIIDWAMDSSINYLKADLTVTPGSGTIQFSTTAIPAGTINVTLFFPGVNGEVVIQTLADVYSKSQVDQKISQSTAHAYQEDNGGLQLNSTLMAYTMLILVFRRYGYWDSLIVPVAHIKGGLTTAGAFIRFNTNEIKVTIDTTGLVALTGTGASDLIVHAWGLF